MYDLLCVLIALLLGGWVLFAAVKLLGRSRPDLGLATPIATAFGLRVGVALTLGQLSVAQQLRGGDELTFLARADDVSALPLAGRDSLDKLTSELHVFLFSGHFRIFDPAPPENMLRVEMITFAVLGILLLSAAVYELAGRRAAIIAAWILALEPSNVFFSSLLHKEPLMYLAEGLVAFGGAVLWKRGDLRSLFPMVLGCLVAIATRPYVGWFLVLATAAVVLHASVVRQRGLRSLSLLAIVVLLAAAFVPVAWDETSDRNLQELQASQDANAEDDEANLSLERVDYSSREKLFLNAPQRIYDVVFKPYPWQTDDHQPTVRRAGDAGLVRRADPPRAAADPQPQRDHAARRAADLPDALHALGLRDQRRQRGHRLPLPHARGRARACACSWCCARHGSSRRPRLEIARAASRAGGPWRLTCITRKSRPPLYWPGDSPGRGRTRPAGGAGPT